MTDAPVEVALAVQPVLDQTRPRRGLHAMVRAAPRDVPKMGGPTRHAGIRGWCARVATEPLRHLGLWCRTTPQPRIRPPRPRLRGLRTRPAAPSRVSPSGRRRLSSPNRPPSSGYCCQRSSARGPAPAAIVRRYRVDSSPVIRDLKHGWRTGRTELVFEGHFDLIAEVWPAAAEERRS
jgi:hypothetical protein